MEKRKRLASRKTVVKDFFSRGEHLYEDQMGWSKREILEARSFVSREIFHFEVETVGLNMAFYYVDNDTFYGIHTERRPIEVKILPRNKERSPYINDQCSGDTHEAGEVIFSCEDARMLWDGISINGHPLEEVLERSLIITLD